MKSLSYGLQTLWVCLVFGAASTVAWASGIESLQRFAETTDTMEAQFEQETFEPSGYLLERTSGRFYFAKPDRFRWESTSPFEETIVADGEVLWHYDVALGQVMRQPQPHSAYSPVMVLTDFEELSSVYSIENGLAAGEVLLFPKDTDTPIRQARVMFFGELPTLIEWEDQFGQLSRLTFASIELNHTLNASLFELTLPKGVDVVEGY